MNTRHVHRGSDGGGFDAEAVGSLPRTGFTEFAAGRAGENAGSVFFERFLKDSRNGVRITPMFRTKSARRGGFCLAQRHKGTKRKDALRENGGNFSPRRREDTKKGRFFTTKARRLDESGLLPCSAGRSLANLGALCGFVVQTLPLMAGRGWLKRWRLLVFGSCLGCAGVAERASFSAKSTSLSAKSISLSAKSISLSAKSTSLSAESISLSAESTSLPAKSISLSAKSTSLSAKSISLSAESISLSAKSTSLSAESTSLSAESMKVFGFRENVALFHADALPAVTLRFQSFTIGDSPVTALSPQSIQ